MNKNSLIAILSTLVVLMAITLIVQDGKSRRGGGCTPYPQTSTNTVEDVKEQAMHGGKPTPPVTVVTNTLSNVKPGAVERIPSEDDGPQHFTSIFEAKAKGTYAKWGGAAGADLYYMLKLVATSKVEKKEEMSGRIRVSEIRSFQEAKEIIKPSKVNIKVDLSTLPVDQIEVTGYLLGGLVSIFEPNTGVSIAETVAELRSQVDALDGQEGRPIIDFLEQFGIDINKIVNEPIEEYLKGLLDEVHSHVNAVQGKSYRFIYWTDKEGEPLRVRYENVDHSPISVEEQNVLNYVNLFIDCHVLPDKNCRPGDHWHMDASSVASMFGVVADGTCSGDVTVTRGNDLPDGNWDLTISPATVTLYSDDKRPIGNVKINGGKAIGDARKVVLRGLDITGKGKLRKHDKETKWWFYDFVTKIEGDCEFRSTLIPRRED